MKSCCYLFNLIKRMGLVILLALVVFGCSHQEQEPAQQEVDRQEPEATFVGSPSVDTAVVAEDMDTVVDKGAPAMSTGRKDDQSPQQTGPKLKENDFEATLEATKKIKLGGSGKLKVWIGMKKYELEANEDMARKATPLYSAYTGVYARITPNADSFIIKADDPGIIVYDNVAIVRVDSTGTDVQYTITPQKKGQFDISASIDLFDNRECLGDPIPKQTNVMKVKVRVDYWSAIWDPVWDGFTFFWGTFVALIFGALLFVVRKYIKRKTGYSDDLKDKILGGGKAEVTEDQKELPEASQKALEEGNDEVTETKDKMPNEEEGEKVEEENRPADE